MNIRNVGHSMKYEAECVAMLFFPDEKIVTAQYEAGAVCRRMKILSKTVWKTV